MTDPFVEDGIVGKVLLHLKGSYFFVGYVNKQWHTAYSKVIENTETSVPACVESISRLQMTRDSGRHLAAATCAYAALGGHLDVLQWARQQECPWDSNTCAYAAKGGRLDIIQWARQQAEPCPWNVDTCAEATRGGHLAVLQWAIANGCPEPE
jgi:hypothetical protein